MASAFSVETAAEVAAFFASDPCFVLGTTMKRRGAFLVAVTLRSTPGLGPCTLSDLEMLNKPIIAAANMVKKRK